MPLVKVQQCGAIGTIKDLSQHDMPNNAWTDSQDIRYLDGRVTQFFGHGEVYASPSAVPQHIVPVNISGVRYWVYATASKCFAVTSSGGTVTHTDITHATPRTGVVNQWTSCLLSGIPILNTGDTTSVPMYWDQNLTHKFVDLTAWPANTYCKSLRAYKNILIALNVTKAGTNYPYMIKWSHYADPGGVPTSWDPTDATKDAGELDVVADGASPIVDGLQLRDNFIVYTEQATHRVEFIGGNQVLKVSKVFGAAGGAMNANCITEIDGGLHLVLGGSDIYFHDGQQTVSILDKRARRDLFRRIDVNGNSKCFVFRNSFFNECYICFPEIGQTSCNRAIVYNYVDKTVTERSFSFGINHAAFGAVDDTTLGTWADTAPWSADLSLWDGPEFVPSTARVIACGANTKLYMLDATASFDGSLPSAYVERRGLSFEDPSAIKFVRGIRPRITGNVGSTVIIKVGYADDPYADPTWAATMTHTIGTTVANDCLVAGRYIAIRFETGTAYQWTLDSFEVDAQQAGVW